MESKKKSKKFDTSKHKDDLKIRFIGGMGEVGKNSYAIEYKSKIYIVDYGVLFPGEEHIGVDYIIPNLKYLKDNENKIEAMFITHGHEDHIGGIPFLLKEVKIPTIYATNFSKMLIEKKLKEHKIKTNIIEINEFSTLTLKDIKIHTYHQTHSIPNSIGLMFETPVGNIATTGDFKVDFSPSGEKMIDFHKIVKLSEMEVLCLLSDSTNSLREGFSESSAQIGENLKLLIKEAEGRILFTTFASHINRVQKIVEGCLDNNRKICVLGRSMKNNLQIAIKSGYIKLKSSDLIDVKEINTYNPEEICIISTGSQGEELAALSRIANGLNNHIELSSEDTVVFASNPIPGNNYQIGKVIDSLHKTECKIIINNEQFKTHTSGHASKEEQKLMLSLFKPKYFIPIHGTYTMLKEHKKTAKIVGIPEENIYLCNNGDTAIFQKNKKPFIKRNTFRGESNFVSGNNINIRLDQKNMNKLAVDGMIVISLLKNKANNKIISYPQITTRGFIVINKELNLIRNIQKEFVQIYNKNYHLPQKELIKITKTKLKNYIKKKTNKSPLIDINVITFEPEKQVKKEINV